MGKPLIGDGQMLAMYETMVRLRTMHAEMAASAPIRTSARAAMQTPQPDVALLAATLLQLRPGDVLVTGGEVPLAAEVLSLAQEATFCAEHKATQIGVLAGAEALFAAGHAYAQMRTARPGDDAPVTVALLNAEPRMTTAFDEAMRVASESVLPLVLIVQDGLAAEAHAIESIANVEVVRLDAEDAVACCRVMQESLLRARNRWGCTVLHAVHLPGGADPVVAFEAHLRRRGIQF